MADVMMPQLGETVTEGTITRWFKQVGDEVALDEALFEVSTDKVDTEVPSPVAGVLAEILADEGDLVEVGQVLARVGAAGDAPPAAEPVQEVVEPPVVEPVQDVAEPPVVEPGAGCGGAAGCGGRCRMWWRRRLPPNRRRKRSSPHPSRRSRSPRVRSGRRGSCCRRSCAG